jgi:polyhydroxyalkanoate synthesis regulator phasin
MTDERQKRADPGDALRDSVRALSGVLGAFKDAIEQTFDDLSERGEISPERARDAAREAMRRAQEAVDDMRGRVDFVTRREHDAIRSEIAELRTQLELHIAQGAHHSHGADAASQQPGTSGPGAAPGGAGGSSMGDGSPGL